MQIFAALNLRGTHFGIEFLLAHELHMHDSDFWPLLDDWCRLEKRKHREEPKPSHRSM